MKKRNPTFSANYLLPITYCLGLIPLVRAGPVQGVEQLLSGLGEVIIILIQFITDTILDINSFDEFLFAKLIFFILIFLVIYVTIKKNDFFGDNETILKIITATISILAVRFIPDELVQVIFLQYGSLGTAIGMFIPFIIILFFLHQSNFGPMLRRIGWFIYGVSYVAIFSYTYTDLIGIAGYVYWTGIIGIIVAYIFDRSIHAAFGNVALRKTKLEHNKDRYIFLNDKLARANKQLTGEKDKLTRKYLREKIKDYEKRLQDARKDI